MIGWLRAWWNAPMVAYDRFMQRELLIAELAARLDRIEMLMMQDPAYRDRAKFNSMCEQVIAVAKAEGQL